MADKDTPAPAGRFSATRRLLVRLAIVFVLVSAAFQYIFHGSCRRD